MKKFYFIAALLFFGINNYLFAQLSFLTPSFQLGASVGYAAYSGSDAFTTDLSQGGLGFSNSARYGVKARLSLPVLPVNFVAYFYYAPLNSSATLSNSSNMEVSTSLSNIGIGFELPLLPGPIKPYFAADYLLSRFGETKITATVPNVETLVTKVEGTNRSGIGVGGGLRFTLLPIIDLDASVKYNMNNLFGKDDGEDTINSISVMATIFVGI